VNPTNGLGPKLFGVYNDYASRQFSAEVTLAGSFNIFNQRQELTIGANRVDTDGGGGVGYGSLINTYPGPYQPYLGGPIYCLNYGQGCPDGSISSNPPINVLNFDPANPTYSEPPNPLARTRFLGNGQVQLGMFINLRLTAFDRLHFNTGLRWSRYESKSVYESICTATIGSCTGMAIGDGYNRSAFPYSDDDFSWVPPINLSFDVTRSIAIYAGYTDIYQSQANFLDAHKKPLNPITGSNWEGGVKWAIHDGKFNTSLAIYSSQKKGFGAIDPPDYSGYYVVSPGVSCCWVADPNRIQASKGIDFEAAGEIQPGWQMSASYVFNENKQKGSWYGSGQGEPLVSIAPKHLYKLWMSYDFGATGRAGSLSGLTLSGGVNGQSSGYNSGSTCIRFKGDPDAVTGAQTCDDDTPANPSMVNYRFTVPSQAILSGRIDYRFSKIWSFALNIDNILDKTYYQTTATSVSGGALVWNSSLRNGIPSWKMVRLIYNIL
jgi:outer-membrane receptor for ferric coprogen and ferric-rhodotorulic acid